MLCCKDVRLKKSCRVSAGHARSDGDVPDAQVHEASRTVTGPTVHLFLVSKPQVF